MKLPFAGWFAKGGDAKSRLSEARDAMAGGAWRRAVDLAAACFDEMRDVDSDVAGHAADVWLAALAMGGRGDEQARAAELCRGAGLSTPSVLRTAAGHAAFVSRRTDRPALETYLLALESGAIEDPDMRRAVLRALAAGLRVPLRGPMEADDFREPALRRLVAVFPRLPVARLFLGRAAFIRGDFAEAVLQLSAVRGPAAETPKVQNPLGRSLEKLGRFDSATRAYARSLASNRVQASVHFRLGRLLLAMHLDET